MSKMHHEEEDGMGFSGLVPTPEERAEERERERLSRDNRSLRASADKPCCRCAKLVWGVTDPDAQVVCEECRKTKAPERTEMERAVLEPYLPEGYDYEDDCSVELAVQLAERDQENAALQKAVSKLQSKLLRLGAVVDDAVSSEPEYPGEMPDEMWSALRGDRDAVIHALRASVRFTKEGISNRIRAALAAEEER